LSVPAPRADVLSATLWRLRDNAGLSGEETARRAGTLSQSKISRFEKGRLVPTEEDIRTLCRIYGAPPETRRELLDIAADLREGSTATRTILQRSSPVMQARIGRIEKSSARMRCFNPAIVIGLLQTHDYIRSLLSGRYSGRELDAMVISRMERQKILDSDRDMDFVMTESALRWHVGSPRVMTDQAQHLAELATELPNVRLGVVPWTVPTNRAVIHGFQIFDDRAVTLNTETAFALITNERDIDDYISRFEIYSGFAVYDDEARVVFERIADEYRVLGE